jgi:FkbM family methyltransferase
MSDLIDLASRRSSPTSLKRLSHPAGVILPFDLPSDASLLIPEVRGAIFSGTYSADIIHSLPDAVREGDRVLVIGAGLGVVSSLVASDGVARVIAVEANTALIPYLARVHALNGVPWVELVNAVLSDGGKGRVPFFVQRDFRASSLLPADQSWQQAMIVPLMDLNLILEEERINLIICDIPATSAQLLAEAKLESVERILVNSSDSATQAENANETWSAMASRGFVAESYGSAILFDRSGATRKNPKPGRFSGFGTSKSA